MEALTQWLPIVGFCMLRPLGVMLMVPLLLSASMPSALSPVVVVVPPTIVVLPVAVEVMMPVALAPVVRMMPVVALIAPLSVASSTPY